MEAKQFLKSSATVSQRKLQTFKRILREQSKEIPGFKKRRYSSQNILKGRSLVLNNCQRKAQRSVKGNPKPFRKKNPKRNLKRQACGRRKKLSKDEKSKEQPVAVPLFENHPLVLSLPYLTQSELTDFFPFKFYFRFD